MVCHQRFGFLNAVTLNDVRDPDFWRGLRSDLSITVAGSDQLVPTPVLTKPQIAQVREDLGREGYVQIDGFFDRDYVTRLAQGIHALRANGLLPVFGLVFDEYWNLARRAGDLLRHLLGAEYSQLPDFWSWYLDPATEEKGWGPHRDKGHVECLLPDGSPMSLTTWIPLTDVSPLNGCMYLLPAHMDPKYAEGVMPTTEEVMQGVRALPAAAGTLFIWNQRVLHWGGSSSRRARVPRVSVAFEFQRGDIPAFNKPLLTAPATLPDFSTRIQLIGKQIMQYTHMYGYDDSLVTAAKHMAEGIA